MLQYGIQTVRKKVTMAQTPFFVVFVTYVISSNPSSPAKDKRVSKEALFFVLKSNSYDRIII